jgi:hypothetical protein
MAPCVRRARDASSDGAKPSWTRGWGQNARQQCVAVDSAFTECGPLLAALAGRILLKGAATERERCAGGPTGRGASGEMYANGV